jgi:hypothetical protein
MNSNPGKADPWKKEADTVVKEADPGKKVGSSGEKDNIGRRETGLGSTV